MAPTPASAGYWLAAADGGVFAFGDAGFAGSLGGMRLHAPIAAMAATPTGTGYWLAGRDGGVFAFGDAAFLGAGPDAGRRAGAGASPIVSLVSTPSGQGYWLAAANGSVFAFGDAQHLGNRPPGQRSQPPVVSMAATPTGLGYWLVSGDGAVSAFGDAGRYGGAEVLRLSRPIVAFAPTPSGRGYWLFGGDGGVFSFGDAPFAGSMGGVPLNAPVVGAGAAPRGLGYWLVAGDGGVFTFGDAGFDGSTGGVPLAAPVVTVAPAPVRLPPRVSIFSYPWYATVDHDRHWRHWEQAGHQPPSDIGANFYPAQGVYSSLDDDLLFAEARQMAAAGVDQIVSSWWGRGSFEDMKVGDQAAAARAAGLDFAIHLEPYPGRSPATVLDDLDHLEEYDIKDVYLYEADRVPNTDWSPVTAAFPEVRFLAETGNLGFMLSGDFARYARAVGFDGVYTYDPVRYGPPELAVTCAAARRERLLCAPSVAPGYDGRRAKPHDQRVVDAAGGARYDSLWAGAIAAGGDVVSITSWNEWHEGTQIEPARPYCFPDGYCSPGYEGIYGRTGPDAERAWVDRSHQWSEAFRSRFGHRLGA